MACLMTMEIILTRLFSIETPLFRLSFGFLPMALLSILYGPLWGGFTYAACDLLGVMLLPKGTPFPGFTLTAFLTGFTYGAILHKKTITWKRVLAAALIVGIFYNLALDTVWLFILTGNAVNVIVPVRLARVAITIPLQTVLITFVWDRCSSIVRRLG